MYIELCIYNMYMCIYICVYIYVYIYIYIYTHPIVAAQPRLNRGITW